MTPREGLLDIIDGHVVEFWDTSREALLDALLLALREPSAEQLVAGRKALRDFGLLPAYTDEGGQGQPPLMEEALRQAFPAMIDVLREGS